MLEERRSNSASPAAEGGCWACCGEVSGAESTGGGSNLAPPVRSARCEGDRELRSEWKGAGPGGKSGRENGCGACGG